MAKQQVEPIAELTLNSYQKTAYITEQPYMNGEDKLIVPLLGLAGEAGELLAEYKKKLRDAGDHLHFDRRVKEELGDLLWYIANIATKFHLELGDIAKFNLEKTQDRWGHGPFEVSAPSFDDNFTDEEKIPRQFTVQIFDTNYKKSLKTMLFSDGLPLGDPLTDNVTVEDGYRFHDVFHLAYAAVLGWSPVTRFLLGVKRKSSKDYDQNQDGGRAVAIEEGISALVYSYAENHHFFKEATALDYSLLRTIKDLVAKYEVAPLSSREWQIAILLGFKVWRILNENKSGVVSVDMDNRTMEYVRPLTEEEILEFTQAYPAAKEKKEVLMLERRARLKALRIK
ncbi:MAG: nucleoside triphosphate pyrophosphohydrolase family protein [Candidatus Obscuribacterales bacterium]|nr:nucleoside triphosphate pyrophosphohydrolase family protein [Candidatus Obscuribacterales bacterium]